MTCKDCIHFESCKNLYETHGEGLSGDSCVCDSFKARARFVELPCMVGDAVFSNVLGKMLEDKITSINIYENGARVLLGRGLWFDIEYIGSVIFLTREEAELALKERENNG